MFTAAKVVAAIAFAFVAWMASNLIRPYLPDGTQIAWFHEVSAAIGLVSGWIMSGARAGDGIRASIGYGLTSGVLIVFWGLFIFSGEEAFQRSLARRYEGPIEAIGDMISMMLDNAVRMAQWDVILWLVVGSIVGGIVTELTSRQWS